MQAPCVNFRKHTFHEHFHSLNVCDSTGSLGSKAWKCGPCVRAVEDAYMRAMEKQEVEFQRRQGEVLGKGVSNIRLQEDNERIRKVVAVLQSEVQDAQQSRTGALGQADHLRQHIKDLEFQHERMLDVQNQILSENASLHLAAQTANQELERSGHVSRDLEHANHFVRGENQTLQDRIQGLLETVSTLREEIRGSYKASEQATQNLSAERREWQTTISTLHAENEDLRRRLAWLERNDSRKLHTVQSNDGAKAVSWTELKERGSTAKS